MADFCSQCSVDLFDGDTRDLARLCGRDTRVAVLCEGCGMIWVDHEGRCQTNCDRGHYWLEQQAKKKPNPTNENPTSESPRGDPPNPTSDS